MKYSQIISLVFLLIISFSVYSQEKPLFDENQLQLTWELKTNNYNKEKKVLASFKLANNGTTYFPSSGWTIYFNYSRKSYPYMNSNDFVISHVNGDICQMKPTQNFKGLKGSQSVVFSYLSNGTILNHSVAPKGFYIVWDRNPKKGYNIKNAVLKPIVDPTINYITPEITYNTNKVIEDIAVEKLPKIFPSPKYFKAKEGTFVLDKKVSVRSDAEFSNEANYLSNELNKVLESNIVMNPNSFGGKQIVLKKANLAKEEYILDIQSDKIEISAASGSGIFYGIQSLKTLFPADSWREKTTSIAIPNCYVKDEPRFEFTQLFLLFEGF